MEVGSDRSNRWSTSVFSFKRSGLKSFLRVTGHEDALARKGLHGEERRGCDGAPSRIPGGLQGDAGWRERLRRRCGRELHPRGDSASPQRARGRFLRSLLSCQGAEGLLPELERLVLLGDDPRVARASAGKTRTEAGT